MIVLFDGVCNLCQRSVQFILRRDRRGRFRFTSLQGPIGQGYLQRSGLPADQLNSFVLVENGKAYTRSSGALRVLRHLGGAWSLLYILWIVPKGLRDLVYDWVARNRYRWFGKKEECWLPKPEWNNRFL